MNIKKTLLLCLLLLLSAGVLSAEEEFNPPEELRPFYELLFQKFDVTEAALELVQQGPRTELVELLEAELDLHVRYFNYLQDLPQDTGRLREAELREAYEMVFWVYHYRTENKDYRPWAEIREDEFLTFVKEARAASAGRKERSRALKDFRSQLVGSSNP